MPDRCPTCGKPPSLTELFRNEVTGDALCRCAECGEVFPLECDAVFPGGGSMMCRTADPRPPAAECPDCCGTGWLGLPEDAGVPYAGVPCPRGCPREPPPRRPRPRGGKILAWMSAADPGRWMVVEARGDGRGRPYELVAVLEDGMRRADALAYARRLRAGAWT